jgi:hypothetical protein
MFDEKENLGPTTIFYLVLTVPENIEAILKKGSFCIEEQCLPKPFKHCANQDKLSLAINASPAKSSPAVQPTNQQPQSANLPCPPSSV